MQYIALAENYPHFRGLISSKITELSGYGLSVIAESDFQLIMQLSQLTVLTSIAIIDVEMPEMDGVGYYPFFSNTLSYHISSGYFFAYASFLKQTITHTITHPHLRENEKIIFKKLHTHSHLNYNNANYCSN